MDTYIGIDVAKTRLAAVVWRGGSKFTPERRTMPEDEELGIDRAEVWTRRLVREHATLEGTVYVGIELPVFGRGGMRGTLPVAYIHAACVLGARRAGATVFRINNRVWKKQICGNGNIDKAGIARFIHKTWPALYAAVDGNQDLCDAACIVQETRRVAKLRARVRATRRG